MCAVKKKSLLTSSDPSALASFSWDSFEKEVQETAPTLYSLLDGALTVHTPPSRRKGNNFRRVGKEGILRLCAAILCRYRNQSMNLVKRIVSLILHRGGASKQVSQIIFM